MGSWADPTIKYVDMSTGKQNEEGSNILHKCWIFN